jgi:hypothetical protein
VDQDVHRFLRRHSHKILLGGLFLEWLDVISEISRGVHPFNMPMFVRVSRLIAGNPTDRTSGVNTDRVVEWKQRVLTPQNSKFIHTEHG